MNLDEFEYLVTRSLELGVPADLVAELFELPLETVTEMQRTVRVARFGTDDMDKYLEGIQFRALEQADMMLRRGSADQAVKIVTAVFGRQIQAAGRRPSNAAAERASKMLETLGAMRDAPVAAAAPGRFVVGRTDVERGAHRDEGEDED